MIILNILLFLNNYIWLNGCVETNSINSKVKVPLGFERVVVEKGSFAEWLRFLPISENKEVLLYNGKKKAYQKGNYAIIDIDVGTKDLQQCADAVMRLRGEYLFSKKDYDNIKFNFTSGDTIPFKKWAEGYRVKIEKNKVSWVKSKESDYSYKNFKKYLEIIFNYAGSFSLNKELKQVKDLNNIEAGNVFIQGGFPGHAIIVLDVAKNKEGKKIFLVAQSYMPAQNIHILKNFNDDDLSPWYSVDFDELITPEWTFDKTDLKRF